NDPDALRQVAKQYESLFARMMIKSMRDAVGKDPMFGSDQEQSYQEMYDDQLSIELTKGKGLGLADMLVKQMQKLAAAGKTATTSPAGAPSQAAAAPGRPSATGLRMFKETGSTEHGAPAPSISSPASSQTQADFISDLWPAAQEAGQQLGVDPRNLIAQAALETNWGTRVPHDASGRSSNNLFGMKTGGRWNGASVAAGTQEYQNGIAVSTTGQFRAYDNRAQSFQDYVALLRNSPRYAAALNTGSNVHAFAAALQRGGYATDPDYASKVSSLAGSINPQLATREPPLKSASARPINPLTGIL
ncbi:MAG TPA: flagellar assembly peptidoglycan hydrolase FlgJ, partial [Steroidobacteraceae bacterium]